MKNYMKFFLLIILPSTALYSADIKKMDKKIQQKIAGLEKKLSAEGVPGKWLTETISDQRFVIYSDIGKYFYNMAERRVKRDEKDLNWYQQHFRTDLKITNGYRFIKAHEQLFEAVETKRGISRELIAAILGMETNYAQVQYKGNFYVFCTLVSQYIYLPGREKFAVNQLAALYRFTRKTGKDVYDYIGSFAGACGWGQFIPSSLLAFFVDSRSNDRDIDIYSLDDNVFSIENYLYEHGLSGSTMDSEEQIYRAVFAYNRSDSYARTIILIYRGIVGLRKAESK